MIICCLNNYPLDKMWALSRSGAIPAQHTWGVDHLAAIGHDMLLAPFHPPGAGDPLERLTRATGSALGQLDQEWFGLRRRRKVDMFYCAEQRGLRGIALARRWLAPTTTVAAVVHHPVRPTALNRRSLLGHDVLICLSEAVAQELRCDLGEHEGRVTSLPWGPALDSPLYAPVETRLGVVSAGKTGRDLSTLLKAVERLGCPARIYDMEGELQGTPPAHVEVVRPGGIGDDPDAPAARPASTVMGDLGAAKVVAVPLRSVHHLAGLTEVNDALAFGKPVVVTRSPYFPFDVEAVGCGIWVDHGDVEGWEDALGRLMTDDALRRTMGDAGRRFAEESWNYTEFCRGLAQRLLVAAAAP